MAVRVSCTFLLDFSIHQVISFSVTSFRSALIRIVEEQMLKRYVPEILQRGASLLLGQHRLVDLTLLFNLLDRVEVENASLRAAVQAYVKVSSRCLFDL